MGIPQTEPNTIDDWWNIIQFQTQFLMLGFSIISFFFCFIFIEFNYYYRQWLLSIRPVSHTMKPNEYSEQNKYKDILAFFVITF